LVLAVLAQSAAAQASGVVLPVLPAYDGHADCNGFIMGLGSDPAHAACRTDFLTLHSTGSAFYQFDTANAPTGQNAFVLAQVDTAGFSNPPLAGVVVRDAGATFTYLAEVVGPLGQTASVSVQSEGGVSANASGFDNGAWAIAEVTLDDIRTFYACSGAGSFGDFCLPPGSVPGQPAPVPSFWQASTSVFWRVGELHVIHLSASASVTNNGSAGANGDPYLAIDPSTPNAGQFTLVLSAGMGPGSPIFVDGPIAAVPEPPTAALVISGCLLLGVRVRRHSWIERGLTWHAVGR